MYVYFDMYTTALLDWIYGLSSTAFCLQSDASEKPINTIIKIVSFSDNGSLVMAYGTEAALWLNDS